MRSICVDFQNCYGIPKLKNKFEFSDKKRAHLIYAPNGVMKTSFATTVNDVYHAKISKDVFYPNRETNRILKFDSFDGTDLVKDDILVIKSYEESYKSENQNVLVADAELKEEYEEVHNEISKKMGMLVTKMTRLSGKREIEETFANDFKIEIKTLYDKIEELYDKHREDDCFCYSNIKYNKLITSDSIELLKDSTIIEKIQEYIEQYEKLLSKSTVFESSFNHNNAENVLKSLIKDGYFGANHKILLKDSTQAIGESEFKEKITSEKSKILDEDLVDEFEKIDKLLSAKKASKDLREFIVNNKHLISELLDIENFKKKLWISYIFEDKTTADEAISNYKNNKKKLREIIKTAKDKLYKWNDVVDEFNVRFSNMPFTIEIANKDDVILKDKSPTFNFVYKNRGEETLVNESVLKDRLSNGEKKALYLLNVIFEIKAKKELGEPCFIVMDDIADSFDYRNKYAIIEYIKEIVDIEYFLPLILTHNFDFYRTVAGRIGIKKTSYFVTKDDNEIKLCQGQYFANVFDSWGDQVYSNQWIFISAIAFVRNLAEYIVGKNDDIYLNLTSLLHYKINTTKDIKVSDLISWYKKIWGRDSEKFKQNNDDSVLNMIYEYANLIISDSMDEIKIEFKILLSIAIRLKTEEYMIKRINNESSVNAIKKDQTRKLKELISFDNTEEERKRKEIIERVLIMTSENIHVNSFMYEPIVDMSLEELKRLYSSVTEELVHRSA